MKHIVSLFLVAFVAGMGCKKSTNEAAKASSEMKPASEQPQRIQVQHILIGFQGSLPGKPVNRTKEQAEKLAQEILDKVKKGGDFDALVKEYTDDRAPGIYGMSNTGVAPEGEEFPREQMVPAFGDVGFNLGVGEVGLANFDAAKSPFGYHIIKRLK